jgi:hypothetical protein
LVESGRFSSGGGFRFIGGRDFSGGCRRASGGWAWAMMPATRLVLGRSSRARWVSVEREANLP